MKDETLLEWERTLDPDDYARALIAIGLLKAIQRERTDADELLAEAVGRLVRSRVTLHWSLPRPGETLRRASGVPVTPMELALWYDELLAIAPIRLLLDRGSLARFGGAQAEVADDLAQRFAGAGATVVSVDPDSIIRLDPEMIVEIDPADLETDLGEIVDPNAAIDIVEIDGIERDEPDIALEELGGGMKGDSGLGYPGPVFGKKPGGVQRGGTHKMGGLPGGPVSIPRYRPQMPAAAPPAAPPAAPLPIEPSKVPRFLRTQVHELDDAVMLERTHSMRRGAEHRIQVWIGYPGGRGQQAPAPFPEEVLNDDKNELIVILTGPSIPDSLTNTITIRKTGDSSVCSFDVMVQGTDEFFEGHILIVYDNRIVQSAVLRARIVDGPDDLASFPILLLPESQSRRSLSDLRGRSSFGAALVIGEPVGGVAPVTSSDGKLIPVTVAAGLAQQVTRLDAFISGLAYEAAPQGDAPFSDATVTLLRNLASHGSVLFQHLAVDGGLNSEGMTGILPLQVISAVPDGRLPVEFVYNRASPVADAPLCPNAAEALKSGKCPGTCGAAAEETVVCPLAFWGYSRVIERHAFSREWARKTSEGDFGVMQEPTSGRAELHVMRGSVMGCSDKLHEVGVEAADICHTVATIIDPAAGPIADWADWITEVQRLSPSLLLLVVHTRANGQTTLPEMEISGDWLTVDRIKRTHIVGPTATTPPLVMLLGCQTGQTQATFANFVSSFRQLGAGIIIATGSTINASQAVPLLQEFVTQLAGSAGQMPLTFGEIMLKLRRKMLLAGMPMALTLTAYGDADWQLVP